VCLIEWPSRLEPYGSAYPTEYLAIDITAPDAEDENLREMAMSAIGERHAKLAERFAQKLNA
jgi:tRNA A37 threonylcarbamoyladenosine biosynthesis protein TsaE